MFVQNKIYVLDGATGTAIQSYNLEEKDYIFEGKGYKGCHDILNITRKDIVLDVHRRYIEAGADIIETNTFNSNSVSLKDYGIENKSYSLSFEGARLAKEAVINSKRKVLIAGSIGPTNKSASIPTKSSILDREISFNELYESYCIQAQGLYDGGADLFLIETIFDGLNAKAAVMACEEISEKVGRKIPIMISATVDRNGKILSGQDIKSLITSLDRDSIVSFGLNCSFGAKDLIPLIESLSEYTDKMLSVYPNAGFPDENGEYLEKPEMMLEYLKDLIDNKKINIIGGCCGTTPKHIELISKYSEGKAPREVQKDANKGFFLSGNSPLKDNLDFYLVGERNNVAGSRKFKRLIEEKRYEEAVEIAREQIENGASIIDINLDDALLDSKIEMETFLKTLSNDVAVSQIPIMVDSSNFDVIEVALKNIPGKAIVNSISLKEGEREFLRKAKVIKSYGAAVVVMAFDEDGQGVEYNRKIEICKRAYNLLIKNGWKKENIVFDPNILTIGTGREEDRYHAVDFIRATEWISKNLEGVKISGGISNISFAFRGNNRLRKLIHDRFLKKAVEKGLNMGIVNPNEKEIEFSEELISLVDRLIDGEDVVEEILDTFKIVKTEEPNIEDSSSKKMEKSVEERLKSKILEGKLINLESDIDNALKTYSPLDIIQNILMDALQEVGDRFEKGEFYLPQIIKSAVVMENAVKYLMPQISDKKAYKNKKGKILMCTVKGDVHDIGKNITKTVLECNGYEVIDLGVMVEKENIYDSAIENGVDAVTLSGLITPSLREMENVLKLFNEKKQTLPIIVSGAATSKLHTALKLEPIYENCVFHVLDASSTVVLLDSLFGEKSELFKKGIKLEYEKLKNLYYETKSKQVNKNIDLARLEAVSKNYTPVSPKTFERFILDIPIEKVISKINWSIFLSVLKVKGSSEEKNILAEATKILKDWSEKGISVKAIYRIYKIRKAKDCLDIDGYKIPLVRNQGVTNESLADYLEDEDYLGLFFASVKADNEKDIFEQLLANTLVEASAEYLQNYVSENNWYVKIRPAIGYPSLPDHSLKKEVFELLKAEDIGVKLTENFSMEPAATVCGIYIGNSKSEYISPRVILDDQIEEISKIKSITPLTLKKYMGI